jgi:FkbM family methyltransferase
MVKNLIKKVLKQINIGVTTYEELEILKEIRRETSNLLKDEMFNNDKISNIIALNESSHAQLKQDLFVLHELNFKRNGFFVEFGATNGLELSNTHLLEKEFNWDGILAEPCKHWHSELRKNRSCNIETDCVWTDSKTILTFNETNYKELSTIDKFSNSDGHKKSRKGSKKYNVNSISLTDLLDKYNAPKIIDYLSIDTEGSEYEILSSFDFNKYSFNIITCEHNNTINRSKVFNLLKENGYVRKFVCFSKWDDWYVRS